MTLSDRKKKILQIVVDEYINTAVPVSSKSITENHLQTISSATVRSELSALEELGYLTQPHTSSGRIPSPEAYKFYVRELMNKSTLSKSDIEYIRSSFTKKSDDLEHIIKNVTKVISELTNYTSVALTTYNDTEIIENLGLFKYKDSQALLLILTDIRLIKDNIISIPKDMTASELEDAARVLNRLFAGKNLSDIGEIEEKLLKEFEEYKVVFNGVIDALKEYKSDSHVILEGEEKIFNYPDYDDVDKVKNFLSVVTSKDKVIRLLKEDGADIELSVKIGRENQGGVPEGCSLVSATYSAGGTKLGKYGVLGPIRMDYKKVISVLENVGKILENIINEK